MNVLMMDNFDSFTYNLVDEFRTKGCRLLVYRNNLTIDRLAEIMDDFRPKLVVLSPGPSAPADAGVCVPLIRRFHETVPILGICLGHQCLIEAFGGTVEPAAEPVHGKKADIRHTGTPVFNGIPEVFSAARYHSLYGSRVPSFFQVTAACDGIPMAIENSEHRLVGLQFHPESILTTYGSRIIENILEVVR
jgi:anthranilate synthase component 2